MYIRLGVHADEKIVDSERDLIRLIGRPFEDIIHIDAFTSMCSGYFKPEEYDDLGGSELYRALMEE